MSADRSLYQYGYSEYFAAYQFDTQRQTLKGQKTLAVLGDYYGGLDALRELSLLDMACSAGLMTRLYAEHFREVFGIDIDSPAVAYAARENTMENLQYAVSDAMNTGFESESFDVVTCTHVYEHVPDAKQLLSEIYRVTKRGGVCYFAAQNRLSLIEPHYGLPLLSVVPKPVAHRYMRLFGKGDRYYENLLTLGSLKRLVSQFEVVDYTVAVVDDPVKYHATDLLSPGSRSHRWARRLVRSAYFLCPTYIWLLRKG